MAAQNGYPSFSEPPSAQVCQTEWDIISLLHWKCGGAEQLIGKRFCAARMCESVGSRACTSPLMTSMGCAVQCTKSIKCLSEEQFWGLVFESRHNLLFINLSVFGDVFID